MNIMKVKDKRIRAMEEVLSGMKIVKLQAWEYSFQDRISLLREEELKYRRR